MAEGAFDVTAPSGSGRRPQGDRVTYLFRLYRKQVIASLEAADDDGVLDTIRGGIRSARQIIQEGLALAQGGRVLVREVKCALIIEGRDEIPEVRSHFSYLRGGIPGENFYLDTPFRNARGITHFRLAGRTFWTPILVDGVAVDGTSQLLELQKLIEEYFYPSDGSTTADHELYWVDLNAAVSAEDPFGASEWWIHPPRHALRTRQNARQPFTWFWSLEFLGLRSNRDLAREQGILGSLFGLDTLGNLLEEAGLGGLAEGIEDVFGVVDEFHGLLDDLDAVGTAVTDVITGTRQFIQVTFAKVRGTLDRVQTLIGRLETTYDLALDIPSLTEEQLRLLQQSYPGLVGDPDSAYVLNDSLRRTQDFLLAVMADPSKFVPPVPNGLARPQTIALQIQPGTTLERLARDANVNATALIEVNGLAHPFVEARVRTEKIAEVSAAARASASTPGPDPVATFNAMAADADRALAWIRTQGIAVDSPTAELFNTAAAAARTAYDRARFGGSGVVTAGELAALQAAADAGTVLAVSLPSLPNVLYAGDVVRVPQDRPESIPSVVGITDGARLNLIAAATGAAVTEAERILGIDLFLNDAGDLEWDATRLDLRLDRGLEHMANVLVRYMRLPQGDLAFAIEVGNYAFATLGRAQTAADTRQLAYAIWRTLIQDPRIRRILNVRALSLAGAAFVRFDAELINGQQLAELRAPLAEAA